MMGEEWGTGGVAHWRVSNCLCRAHLSQLVSSSCPTSPSKASTLLTCLAVRGLE